MSTKTGRAEIDGLLTKQFSVVTRAQALGAGLTLSALRHRLRDGGPWQALLPGIYLAATGAASVDQREMAAILYGGPASMVTGLAALSRHNIRTPRTDAVDVLVPALRHRHDAGYVRLHRTTRMPARVFTIGELRYAPPIRAVADAARLMTDIRGVRAVVADSVQLGKCTPGHLAEAELRDLIRRAHQPGPVLFNAQLYAGTTFIAAPDCWWPKAGVAVEVDSREWHLLPADWERTMSRRAKMSSYGIIVLHFSPRQIRTEPEQVVRLIRSTLNSAAGRSPLTIRVLPAA
jgi:very-short-patch-repair endonuclease